MTRTKRFTAGWALAGLAVLLLSGCSKDMSDLQQHLSEVKSRPAQPIAPIPQVSTYTPYTYDGYSGRDPFRSSTTDGSEQVADEGNRDGPRPDFTRPKEYLERYELDTLIMVGTFSKDNAFWGLVRDPDGVVHRVSIENFMGKNHGQIVNIQDSQIDLTELIADGAGGWLVREASVALETGS
jgi:type IV pilus assembly protein PilP